MLHTCTGQSSLLPVMGKGKTSWNGPPAFVTGSLWHLCISPAVNSIFHMEIPAKTPLAATNPWG